MKKKLKRRMSKFREHLFEISGRADDALEFCREMEVSLGYALSLCESNDEIFSVIEDSFSELKKIKRSLRHFVR